MSGNGPFSSWRDAWNSLVAYPKESPKARHRVTFFLIGSEGTSGLSSADLSREDDGAIESVGRLVRPFAIASLVKACLT